MLQAHGGSSEADARSRPRTADRAAAVVVPLLCAVALACSAWLDLRAQPSGPAVRIAPGASWPFALNGLVIALLAATILRRGRDRTLGRLVALLGVFWAADGLAQGYIRAGLTPDEAWPGMTFAIWFLNRFGAFLPVSVAVLLLLFPTGRLLPGAWGLVGRVALALSLGAGAALLLAPAEGRLATGMLPPGVDLDPASLELLSGHGDQVHSAGIAAGVVGFLLTMVLVAVRYRASRGLMRDRMRWLLWSVVVIGVLLAAGLVVEVPESDYVVAAVVMVLPIASMTVAVVSPTILPIQDVLGRTVVLTAVLLALVAADVVVLALLTLALGDELSQAQVVAVVLAVAVLLYGPLRQRLSSGVQRLMLGERGNRYDAVAGLASTLETTDDTAEQLAVVARAVASAFAVSFVSVEVDRGHGERLVTTYGERPAQVRTLPITYRGAGVGRLVLPARGLRSRLTAQDERLLGDLVRQAATAARTSRLAEEVQHSRERLVTAREEERRRIRRDLHDGLGPALSGIVFQLEAARMTVATDPVRAQAQLESVSAHVQDVVADVRRLVHDLRPPALDDRGLVGALRQQADLLDLAVDVQVPVALDGRLPAAVEVAAYRIVGEALTNVARHARATRTTVVLRLTDDDLLLEVCDDGVGIRPERQAGVGLASLRERAAELGGTSDITCPPDGGTVVRARLPLRSTA